MPELSAFKNYKPGDPTCRLYIKNLAKTVDEKVAFIFGYILKHWPSNSVNRFLCRRPLGLSVTSPKSVCDGSLAIHCFRWYKSNHLITINLSLFFDSGLTWKFQSSKKLEQNSSRSDNLFFPSLINECVTRERETREIHGADDSFVPLRGPSLLKGRSWLPNWVPSTERGTVISQRRRPFIDWAILNWVPQN